MVRHRAKTNSINLKRKKVRGRGILNSLIDKLPFELHLPNFNYCGPATKLRKRLDRGDIGINQLDEACKKHDIAYSQFKDVENRNKADKVLAKSAWERVKASDSSIGEKLAAMGVAGIMTAKHKLGMGMTKTRKGRGLKFTRKTTKGAGLRRNAKLKKKNRVIPIPKTGGVLKKRKNFNRKKGGFLQLLLPILGALGALGGGAAGIAKAVNDAKANKEQLEELKRHDIALEKVKGEGVKLGRGVYLTYPYPKNSR